MEATIRWSGEELSSDQKRTFELKLQSDLLSKHMPVTACHGGPIKAVLYADSPFATSVSGSLFCNCGSLFASIRGTATGSTITYHFEKA